jgi:hypothetical protein
MAANIRKDNKCENNTTKCGTLIYIKEFYD